MNLNKSKDYIQSLLRYEILNMAVMFITILYVTICSIRIVNELRFCIPGFISAIIGFLYLVFSWIKTRAILQIDYYNTPVIKLQKEVATLNGLILKLRRIEIVLIPFLTITILPIFFKFIHHVDIYENIKLFAGILSICLGVSLPVTLWINKYFYDTKIRDTKRLLHEIESFEDES